MRLSLSPPVLDDAHRMNSTMLRGGLVIGLTLVLASGGTGLAAGPDDRGAPVSSTPVAAPDTSLLGLKLEKGLRVTLDYSEKSAQAKAGTTRQVQVEVVDQTGEDFVIRWEVLSIDGQPVIDPDKGDALAEGKKVKPPVLELAFRRGLGLVGLHDWQKSRDLQMTFLERVPQTLPAARRPPQELVQGTLDKVRQRLQTREATEQLLLADVRPFFAGAYTAIAPGATLNDTTELPLPFGESGTGVANRTTHLPVPPEGAAEVTLEVEASLDPMLNATSSEHPVLTKRLERQTSLKWTLDRRLGWPKQVVYTTTDASVQRKAQTMCRTWTLTDGPAAPVATVPTEEGR